MDFIQFIDHDSEAYVIFMLLYWTGMRVGEVLALNIEDIDFSNGVISVSKSYQRIKQRDVITPPKTPKGKRKIKIPLFLTDCLKQFIDDQKIEKDGIRIFKITKYHLLKEMRKGIEESKVKTIRIHDLRHPYVKPTTKKFITFFEVFRAAS